MICKQCNTNHGSKGCPQCDTCPHCSTGWTEVYLKNGVCPRCNYGLNRARAARNKSTPRTTSLPKTFVHLRMKRLSQRIAGDYGIKLIGVEFRNRRGSVHRYSHEDGTHRVIYSISMVEDDAENGYQEYPQSFSYLWPPQSQMKGLKAAYALVVHEMGHAVQRENGGRWRGSQHNSYWADAVRELQELYPFSEFN